jgi:zinc protease
VYREQKAQDADAFASGRELAGQLSVRVRAREGVKLAEMERAALEEVRRIAERGVEADELARAKARYEAEFIAGLQTLTARADRLNAYQVFRGSPDRVNDDLARFLAVTPADVQRVARQYLLGPKVVLATVPTGRADLAAAPEATP